MLYLPVYGPSRPGQPTAGVPLASWCASPRTGQRSTSKVRIRSRSASSPLYLPSGVAAASKGRVNRGIYTAARRDRVDFMTNIEVQDVSRPASLEYARMSRTAGSPRLPPASHNNRSGTGVLCSAVTPQSVRPQACDLPDPLSLYAQWDKAEVRGHAYVGLIRSAPRKHRILSLGGAQQTW